MRSYSQSILGALVVIVAAGALTSCGFLGKLFERDPAEKKEDPKKEESEGDKKKEEEPSLWIAGEIASVHEGEGFVLIRRYASGGGFGSGDLVASRGPNGSTASLKLTGEQLGKFFAADVQTGTPSKGDLVTVRRLPKSEKPASTPLPAAPQTGPGAEWMKNSLPAGL